ncbi:hypothetical protein [Vaginisenegalia massiliensis]|uniref:hypothetical protein n=1 Tax=Vaginisenegalia massiliensis TaxID=2058294 RepID=UPI000F54BB8D|nr:hypothetical protein [Vaginisenegalia massiliensis]
MKEKRNGHFWQMILLLSLMGSLIIQAWVVVPILAQESSEESSYDSIESVSEMSESFTSEEDPLSEDSETSEESTSMMDETPIQDFSAYAPYIHYINYRYQTNNQKAETMEVIMEYTPDNNGIFQIAVFANKQVSAHVLQIRSTGLYELATFDQYSDVKDLRYSPEASDADESLIMPSDLTVGKSFKMGGKENGRRKILAPVSELTIGNHQTFSDVICIQEEKTVAGQVQTQNYYYAAGVGLIYVEQVDSQGHSNPVLQITSTQGKLN